MRAKKKGNRVTYQYKGNLQNEIVKAEIELAKIEQGTELLHLKWAYDKAKKEYEAKANRMDDLREFIRIAKLQTPQEDN